ncbi:MAG: hypothetical protein KDI37_10595 [Xanthomonadales bacterium]|nr:hypothetical protein [Xanthomonadales bacterium]MCB1628571.1 hypothetical protein [Xanthomonadales bacterium]MCB1642171.1 hypothetical protein [Xanthomonadales bacterium]
MKVFLEHAFNSIFFLLGLMHTVLTLANQRPFDLDALMYTGAGLAFIFLSFFNFARVKSKDWLTKLLSLVVNVLTLLYVVLIAVVFADPRVAIAIVALAVLVVLSMLDLRSASRPGDA